MAAKAKVAKSDAGPKRRRARGTGSVFWSAARGVWVGRAVVAGRRVERSDPSQEELVRKLALATPPPSGLTVGEWVARWRADPETDSRVKPATRRSRASTMGLYVLPSLGAVRLASLTPQMVERAVRSWTTLKSANSVQTNLANLSACLRAAVRAGLIPANPVSGVRKPPPHRRADVVVFTGAELARVAAAAGPRPGAARPLALLAATGMRVGEAIGLDVGHFDPAAGELSVERTCDPCEGPLESTKSANGRRVLPLPAAALAAVAAAAGSRKAGPLFAGARGGRCRYPEVARAWRALLAELGLPYRNLHVLRHSVGSQLAASGMPLADVARWLGDTVATVLKTYVRPTGADVAGAIDRLFSGAVGRAQGGRGKAPKVKTPGNPGRRTCSP